MWFTTFCTGFGKALVATKSVSAMLTGDVTAATRVPLLGSYTAAAVAYTATGKALTALPAPTITGGAAIATEVPKGLISIADTITALRAESVSAPVSQLVGLAEAKQATLQTDVKMVLAPIDALDKPTQANLGVIPACAEMQKMVLSS